MSKGLHFKKQKVYYYYTIHVIIIYSIDKLLKLMWNSQ